MSKFVELIDMISENGDKTANMEEVTSILDNFFYKLKSTNPDLYKEAMCKLEEKAYTIDKDKAYKIVKIMKPRGEVYTMEAIKKFLAEKGITEKCRLYYLVINMYANDSYDVAKKFSVDDLEFYFEMAKSFINDEDAIPLKVEKYFLNS